MSKFWRKEETYAAPVYGPIVTIGVPPISELLSMGWQEKTITETHPRTGALTVRTADYRLLCHHRHRGEWFIQWGGEHGPIEPLQHHSGQTEKVTPMGTVRTNTLPPGRTPAPSDRVTLLEEWNG